MDDDVLLRAHKCSRNIFVVLRLTINRSHTYKLRNELYGTILHIFLYAIERMQIVFFLQESQIGT